MFFFSQNNGFTINNIIGTKMGKLNEGVGIVRSSAVFKFFKCFAIIAVINYSESVYTLRLFLEV
jgi:hypothetical protein